jgi:hypothetical protein
MEGLLTNSKLDERNKVIMEEFAKAQDSDYNRIKFLMFSIILTRSSDSDFLQKTFDKFPNLAKDKISMNELKNIIREFKISPMEDIEDIFKPDCEIYLIHLYLLMSKKPDLNIIKKLHLNQNNPFNSFDNILETYIIGCQEKSFFGNRCDSDIFLYLYKPEYITETIMIYYCTVWDADATILQLIFNNKNKEKNFIIAEKQKWTYLHIMIWNGTWGSVTDDTKKQFDCYKVLVTDENKLMQDYEGKTPFDLYKEIYGSKLNSSIQSLLEHTSLSQITQSVSTL